MKALAVAVGLALASCTASSAAEDLYVTVATYESGAHFQAWKALPKSDCLRHIPLIDVRSVPNFQNVKKPLACEKADTTVMESTKTGKTLVKRPFGIGPTTAAICKEWIAGPLKRDAKAGVTYTCEKVK